MNYKKNILGRGPRSPHATKAASPACMPPCPAVACNLPANLTSFTPATVCRMATVSAREWAVSVTSLAGRLALAHLTSLRLLTTCPIDLGHRHSRLRGRTHVPPDPQYCYRCAASNCGTHPHGDHPHSTRLQILFAGLVFFPAIPHIIAEHRTQTPPPTPHPRPHPKL